MGGELFSQNLSRMSHFKKRNEGKSMSIITNRNRVGNRSQGVFWSSGWVKEETDLDSDWQIGNDVEHVVATIFRPPRYSA
jgi:hypothetical protein